MTPVVSQRHRGGEYIYLLYVVADLVEQSVLEADIVSSVQEVLWPLWNSKIS
jgi:hypothetical protein